MLPNNMHLEHRELVCQFMARFQQQMPKAFVDAHTKTAEQRFFMLEEEGKEWEAASAMSANLLDALLDILYIAHGNLLALGLKLEEYPELPNMPASPTKFSVLPALAAALASLIRRPLCGPTIQKTHISLLHVVYLALQRNGYDTDGAFKEVHRANMTKIWTAADLKQLPMQNKLSIGGDQWIVFNERGKVAKPPGWKPKDLEPFNRAAQLKFRPVPMLQDAPPPPASVPSEHPSEDPPEASSVKPRRLVKSRGTGRSSGAHPPE